MFPEKDFIVRIYEAMCNYLQVAEGFGINSVHDFDLNLFCKTFKFPILPAYHALKILEQSGYIEYIEEADSQSRVMVTVHRDELYKLKTDDPDTDTVLQCLLRSYTPIIHLSKSRLSNGVQGCLPKQYTRVSSIWGNYTLSIMFLEKECPSFFLPVPVQD